MTPDDYDIFIKTKDLCALLNLYLRSDNTNGYFIIYNDSFEMLRCYNMKEVYYWLLGFKQCKRLVDNDFNKLVLDMNGNEE